MHGTALTLRDLESDQSGRQEPRFSRQIATLEAGTQLVERGARGIRLTPAGELLVETEYPDVCSSLVEARSPESTALIGPGELDIAVVSDSEGDLGDEIWIEGRGSIVSHALRVTAARAGFEPRIGFESTQWLGKQGLVAAGVGNTLIPTAALAAVHDERLDVSRTGHRADESGPPERRPRALLRLRRPR